MHTFHIHCTHELTLTLKIDPIEKVQARCRWLHRDLFRHICANCEYTKNDEGRHPSSHHQLVKMDAGVSRLKNKKSPFIEMKSSGLWYSFICFQFLSILLVCSPVTGSTRCLKHVLVQRHYTPKLYLLWHTLICRQPAGPRKLYALHPSVFTLHPTALNWDAIGRMVRSERSGIRNATK